MMIRRRIERRITNSIIHAAIRYGYDLQVYLDGEDLCERTKDAVKVLALLMDLDDAFLKMRKPDTDDNHHDAWVRFVYGNDGWDCVCDYTTNLDDTPILTRANRIAELWSG